MRPVTLNTMENNKLIAEFLNTDVNNDGTYELPQFGTIRPNGEFKTSFTLEQMKFDKDWNWIMEVVDKIESIVWEELNETSFNVTIGATSYCIIQDNNGELVEIIGQGKTKIESVYKAVLEFINYYNAIK
jgi:hypothetical protein